jgi:ribosomal protein S18 acetylase RimI-like enzyme
MIRKATSDDYPLFLAIQTACINGLTDVYSADEIKAWTDYLAREGAARYGQYENRVGEDEDGNVAGFVSWSSHEALQASIECLYILPQFRNQGIGRRLLQEAEASFNPAVTVRIRSTRNALPFYERQGYKRTGDALSRAGFRIVLLEKTV